MNWSFLFTTDAGRTAPSANAYRLLFHGQTSVFDACIQIEQQVPDSPAIRNILDFVRGTEEGIISKL